MISGKFAPPNNTESPRPSRRNVMALAGAGALAANSVVFRERKDRYQPIPSDCGGGTHA
jgi:hypothetical protein